MLKTAIAHSEILDLITRTAADLKARMRPGAALVGIHTGGVWVAEHLNRHLGLPDPLGDLNIAFYRDDFSHIGMHPSVRPSTLPFDVDGRHIVLVDDVLFTGRTVRAALNEICAQGAASREGVKCPDQ